MKILYIIDKPLALWGAELHLLDILKYRKDKNEICCIILGSGKLDEIIKKLEIKVIAINWPRIGTTKKHLRILANAIKEFSPDIVHSHKPTATYYGSLICKKLGIPHISTIHAIPSHTASNKSGIKYILSLLLHIKLQYFSEYRSIKNIFVSQQTLNKYSFFKGKAIVIHNWISPRFSKISKARIRDESNKYLCISSLVPNKGILKVIELFHEIKMINPKANLTILGDSDNITYKTKISTVIKDLGLSQSIKFPGYQTNPERYYNESDVFISLTQGETFGLVFAEAMYFGLPIICTDIEILRETVSSDNLFVKNNRQSSETFLRKFTEPQNIKMLSARNHTWAKNRYEFENQQKQLHAIYISILDNKHK